jgi:cytochrome c oxidase subunit 2
MLNNFLLLINNSYCDAPYAWQINLQEPATPAAQGMVFLHNYLCFFMVLIACVVYYFLADILFKFRQSKDSISKHFTHSSILEIVWTIIPGIILVFIAIPSFALLYSTDELVNPVITWKIIGRQWYWTYEMTDVFFKKAKSNTLTFDAYLTPEKSLLEIPANHGLRGSFRLLETDRRLPLPSRTHIRLLVTSTDVLHSWAVPSFGIKVDACPGRLTQASLYIKRHEGTFYGQCSEICGVNHGFMPIVVMSVTRRFYRLWLLVELGVLKYDPRLFTRHKSK